MPSGPGAAYSAPGPSEAAGPDSSCRSLCGQGGGGDTKGRRVGPAQTRLPIDVLVSQTTEQPRAKAVPPREMGSVLCLISWRRQTHSPTWVGDWDQEGVSTFPGAP